MPTRQLLENLVKEFEKALAHFKQELAKLQIGRAVSSLIEDIQIEAYGTKQSLKALASISILDAHTLQVQPWDKSILAQIEKGIRVAEMNFNPINDGVLLRIIIPPLNEERRKELSKLVGRYLEEARISIRNVRQMTHKHILDLEKNKEISEDERHIVEKKLQQHVDEYNRKVEELGHKKVEDIMRV